jgi:hypothetical protein
MAHEHAAGGHDDVILHGGDHGHAPLHHDWDSQHSGGDHWGSHDPHHDGAAAHHEHAGHHDAGHHDPGHHDDQWHPHYDEAIQKWYEEQAALPDPVEDSAHHVDHAHAPHHLHHPDHAVPQGLYTLVGASEIRGRSAAPKGLYRTVCSTDLWARG